jgi:3alpha(or 20beta)-hydroxysteroid dehydrogenase
VIACDVSWPALEDGQRVLDVTSEADWQSLASSLAGEPVHGLVNNAGIPLRSRLGEVSLADWNRVFAVNVTGPMLGIQALAPMMGPGSSIVNVGSLAAVTGHAAVAYTSSKWALRGLSKTASLTLGSRGIRVNLVNPGFIETPMTDAAPAVFRDANITNTPLGRAGRVEDVVPMVVFLLSPESSFISGAEIPVDGGQWAHGGAMHNYTYEASR